MAIAKPRSILVTGETRGIGRAFVEAASREGHQVVLTGIRQQEAGGCCRARERQTGSLDEVKNLPLVIAQRPDLPAGYDRR